MVGVARTLFAWLLLGVAPIAAEPIAVYLTWKEDPATSMVVQWITRKRERGGELNLEGPERKTVHESEKMLFPEGAPLMIHRVALTGLKPDTEYRFSIGETERKFRTLPANVTDPLTFVIGGDIYHDEIELVREMNGLAAAESPAFAVAGGDLAYAAPKFLFFKQDVRKWITWLQAWSETMITPSGITIPMVPLLGNHDVTGRYDQTPAQADIFYSLFALPGNGGYYAFDVGDLLSLIVLDSGHAHPVDGAQRSWLDTTLSSREHRPHLFAAYHVPAYPSVRKFENRRSKAVRKEWVPLFEEHGLHVAFEHHDHAYKRTRPIFHNQPDETGVVYIGDGAWGVAHPRRPYSPAKLPYLAASAQERHVIAVTVSPEMRKTRAIASSGEVFDVWEEQISPISTHEKAGNFSL